MKISEEQIIELIPSYLKIIEEEQCPFPAVIATMGVDFGETEAQIKLTSLKHRNISITFYIPEEVRNKFIDMYERIKNEDQ